MRCRMVLRPGLGYRAYQSKRSVTRAVAPRASEFTHRRCRWHGVVDLVGKARNTTKSRVRAKVEHSIGVIKRVFAFSRVRHCGLAKNAQRLFVAAGLASLYLSRRRLLAT